MIKELDIRNFFTIKQIHIDLSDRITCFTGESGTGKSVLASVLIFLFGKDMTGGVADGTFVSARISQDGFKEGLGSMGYDIKKEFTLKRFVHKGRSKFSIDEKPINKNTVQTLFLNKLITTHQNSDYFTTDTYLKLFDKDYDLSKYIAIYNDWKTAKNDFYKLNEKIIRDKNKYEYAKTTAVRIKKVKPIRDEIENLRTKLNSEKMAEKLNKVNWEIDNLLNGEGKLLEILASLKGLLNRKNDLEQLDYDDSIDNFTESIKELNLKTDNQADQGTDSIKKRLSDLRMLEFTLKKPLNEIIKQNTQIEQFIAQYEELKFEITKSEKRMNIKYAILLKTASDIHDRRIKVAANIESRMKNSLKLLGVNCEIEFRFARVEPNLEGIDSVNLLFSANPQIAADIVKKTASGGERSRIVLSLLAEYKNNQTLITDEIDDGVSGKTAQKVGSLLKLISSYQQIILITHKPQIAALANIHYKVDKKIEDGIAITQIKRLTLEERKKELASLISTDSSSSEAFEYAEKLLS